MAIQRSFAGGEVGPTFYGGADFPRYLSALATCRNFILMKGGGVANRPGHQFIVEVKTSSVRTYLLTFIFSADDTYVIEAGAGYFRFVREGAQVTVGTPDAWADVTAYEQGDLVVHNSVNYYCIADHTSNEANDEPGVGTNWEDFWYALTGDILEIPTPYAAGHLSALHVVQSGDVLTITHPEYQPRELKRFPAKWTLTLYATAPGIAAPANLAATEGTAGPLAYSYKVTAVHDGDYEESVASANDDITCTAPTEAAPNTLAWDAVADAAEYNVYLDKDGNGLYGFIGIASTNAFNDIGFEPDFSVAPPVPRVLFEDADERPGTAGYYQHRLVFGGTNTLPEDVFASRSGFFKNHTISSPIQDDDAIQFRIAGRGYNEIRHLIEVGKLVILTSIGEWVVVGDVDGVLRPTAINLRQQSFYGASTVQPSVIGNNLIYVQARGGIVRDLRFDSAVEGYDGRDLTVYAPHLFEGKAIERMAFAQMPHSINWAVRSDGVLLGLTYLREFDIWGWHRHDTGDGDVYEDVVAVPETTPPPPGSSIRGKEEDAVYVVVKRTIDGQTKRYIERFASRQIEDYRLDGHFLDSFLTYNGVNDVGAGVTVTLTTAAGWTTADLITVTASSDKFAAGDVGNGVTVWDPTAVDTNKDVNRIVITEFVSATVVKGNPISTVAASLRNTATLFWSLAVDEVAGLEHLEGRAVSILANGVVLAATVDTGAVPLAGLYDIVHVGLPIEADVETLDLDSQDAPLRDRKKLVKSASLLVERSRGVQAGPDFDHLTPHAAAPGTVLGTDIFSESGGVLRTEIIEVALQSTWNKPGRVAIRQSDPLPLAILGVMPSGDIGG